MGGKNPFNRQMFRERERERDRQREREGERQTETDRQTDGRTDIHTDRQDTVLHIPTWQDCWQAYTGASISMTDRPTGRRTILLWTNSMGRIARSVVLNETAPWLVVRTMFIWSAMTEIVTFKYRRTHWSDWRQVHVTKSSLVLEHQVRPLGPTSTDYHHISAVKVRSPFWK